MEAKAVEAIAVSTTLIATIGWWDFIHRGGSLNLSFGIIGTMGFVLFAVRVLSGQRRLARKLKAEQSNKQ